MLSKNNKQVHSNDRFITGYKTFDEPDFGKCPQERLKTQPDYRANIIWPLFQYYQERDCTTTKQEFQNLLNAYYKRECIEGTDCLYRLKGYLEIYLIRDADQQELFVIGDRTHGFIPAFIYSLPSRTKLDGSPGNPRSDAFYNTMEDIKNNLDRLMEEIELNKDDWYALQKKLPQILNYSS